MADVARRMGLLALGAALIACGTGGGRAGAGDAEGPGAGGGGPTSSGSAGNGAGGGSGGDASLGVVVVDVQEAFVGTASNPDMPAIVDRTRAAFELASAHQVPFFITFEASQQGDHALHAPLVPVLPAHAADFVKTTFDATGLPAFAQAVGGLTHVVVLGAETDVCVLQTVLGLRALGLTVLLEADAVFTEETNPSPALRRMEQAGAVLATQVEVAGWLDGSAALPAPTAAVVRITRPLEVGVVLHAFTDATVGASNDPLETQKSARLRELLLVGEWFELPVYVEDVAAGLPSAFAQYYSGTLRPVSQIASDPVSQLVVAGTDGALGAALDGLAGHELFVLEDALLALGTDAEQESMLAPYFAAGLVPTTYKSFYYDMTKSVSLDEWPSQQWVRRFDPYYWLTQAPEDLPPMPPDP
jgi:nicotinamidase-related amidase